MNTDMMIVIYWVICVMYVGWSLTGKATRQSMKNNKTAKVMGYFFLVMAPVFAPIALGTVLYMTTLTMIKFSSARRRLIVISVELKEMAEWALNNPNECQDRLTERWEELEIESNTLMKYVDDHTKKVM